jgi:glutathione S-transferase
MTVQLYGFPPSTYTQTCMIGLTEKDIEFQLVMPNLRSEEYAAFHPMRKVPVLAHGGTIVFESLAILDYVDRAFSGPRLFPEALAERAAVLAWTSAFLDYFAHSILEYSVRERFAKPLMGLEPDEDLIERHTPEFLKVTAVLDRRLGQVEFVGGAYFSAADMFYAPVYLYFSHSPEGQKALGAARSVQRWLATVRRRPSIAACCEQIELRSAS